MKDSTKETQFRTGTEAWSILEMIAREGMKGLSPANIVRLIKSWEDDYKEWTTRDLRDKKYVYFW